MTNTSKKNAASSKKNTQNSNTQSNKMNTTAGATGATAEVLYQRMGDRWFAFSVIEDEVFVGSMTPEEIHGKTFKISGNS
jgi:hypothetical protein